jgi:NAD(P)H-dependent flavin oxidoreductase YrpB (nitropropane dioxygenase family)
MLFPKLKINKNTEADKPIIQGGMAIRVSRAPLAAAVANCGGIGVIAISGLPEPELREQIRYARSLITNKGGLLGVNIMYAAAEFNNLVRIAIEEKVDLIIFGAGFSRDIFGIGREANIPIVPIVSSAKLAVMAKRLGASTIIVESGEAGGHVGTCDPIRKLIPEIRQAIDAAPACHGTDKVSLIAAGGVTSGADIMEMLSLGADGVQMATRFVLSNECDVHDNFKKLFLQTEEKDVCMIKSPVGMPARAILTSLTKRLAEGTLQKPTKCDNCLKLCSHSFCIIRALEAARTGDLENGLFFTGGNVTKYRDIISVKEIFQRLENEALEYQKKKFQEVGKI